MHKSRQKVLCASHEQLITLRDVLKYGMKLHDVFFLHLRCIGHFGSS